jgi:hypothetical protein
MIVANKRKFAVTVRSINSANRPTNRRDIQMNRQTDKQAGRQADIQLWRKDKQRAVQKTVYINIVERLFSALSLGLEPAPWQRMMSILPLRHLKFNGKGNKIFVKILICIPIVRPADRSLTIVQKYSKKVERNLFTNGSNGTYATNGIAHLLYDCIYVPSVLGYIGSMYPHKMRLPVLGESRVVKPHGAHYHVALRLCGAWMSK